MTTSSFIRMNPDNVDGAELSVWPVIPPDRLVAGTPVQRGVFAINDQANGLSAGIWDCTPFTSKPGMRAAHEIMYILEGGFTAIDETGVETPVRAGEAIFLPQGRTYQWKQTQYIKKYFMIFNDASGAANTDPVAQPTIKIDLGNLDDAATSGAATQTTRGPGGADTPLFVDRSGKFRFGFRRSGANCANVAPSSAHEIVTLVEGSLTLSDGAGRAETFTAGETVLIPAGAPIGWETKESVTAIFSSMTPA